MVSLLFQHCKRNSLIHPLCVKVKNTWKTLFWDHLRFQVPKLGVSLQFCTVNVIKSVKLTNKGNVIYGNIIYLHGTISMRKIIQVANYTPCFVELFKVFCESFLRSTENGDASGLLPDGPWKLPMRAVEMRDSAWWPNEATMVLLSPNVNLFADAALSATNGILPVLSTCWLPPKCAILELEGTSWAVLLGLSATKRAISWWWVLHFSVQSWPRKLVHSGWIDSSALETTCETLDGKLVASASCPRRMAVPVRLYSSSASRISGFAPTLLAPLLGKSGWKPGILGPWTVKVAKQKS